MDWRIWCAALLLLLYSSAQADFKEGGEAYKRGDFAAAAAEFIPLAERGDHRAMYALGSMYAAGQGVEKDLQKAYELFFEAAQNGRIDAMYKLGLMYEEGLGIKQNYDKALRNYRKSAQKGYPLSQYRFGLMYADGKGIKQNVNTAYAWLVIAGHYFVYESGKTGQSGKSGTEFTRQLLLFRQQEMDRITENIIAVLEKLRKDLTQDDIEKIRKKVAAYSKYKKRYHSPAVRNLPLNGNIEKLFLPDTLY